MLKSKIRKKILKIRENKNKGKIHIKFSKIYSLLKKKTNLRKKIIGGYYPVNYEVDDLEILKKFVKKKIKISLPVIKKNFRLDFIQCSLDSTFTINQYGIPEPGDGKVVYPDHEAYIPSFALDDTFIDNFSELIQRLASHDPARKVPSKLECSFCNITSADCKERVETDITSDAETDDF